MNYNKTEVANGMIFLNAATLLYKEADNAAINLQEGNTEYLTNASLCIAGYVNSALASEIFIKSMLPPKTKGHKLDELFKKLPEVIKDATKQLTVTLMKKSLNNYTESDFDNDLINNSEGFIKWRYFHEGKVGNASILFMRIFAQVLRFATDIAKNVILNKNE